mmetsp:Transcript_18649/g.45880  ORF Transcript_18649/g.45880 Transcript_18649/m.45880 type:complete len:177 (+) Transcript_18649:2774-3304(+)
MVYSPMDIALLKGFQVFGTKISACLLGMPISFGLNEIHRAAPFVQSFPRGELQWNLQSFRGGLVKLDFQGIQNVKVPDCNGVQTGSQKEQSTFCTSILLIFAMMQPFYHNQNAYGSGTILGAVQFCEQNRVLVIPLTDVRACWNTRHFLGQYKWHMLCNNTGSLNQTCTVLQEVGS